MHLNDISERAWALAAPGALRCKDLDVVQLMILQLARLAYANRDNSISNAYMSNRLYCHFQLGLHNLWDDFIYTYLSIYATYM